MISHKIRLKPTREQEAQLWKSVGTARWVYNWVLERQEENYKQGNKFIQDGVLRREITQLKKTTKYRWLYEVSNNVTKQAIKDACDAYKKFFKGLSKKPNFKSRKKSRPSFYNDTVSLKVKKYCTLIEKVGWVRTSEQIPMDVKYYNPRITYDGKYWYLSVSVEVENQEEELTEEVVGVDLGIKDLAICSNGTTYKNINKTKIVKQLEKRLRRLQRKLSRKHIINKRGEEPLVKTCNIIKIEKKIQLIQRRLTNIRTNHIHQTTSEIISRKPRAVVLEDLNVKGMMKNRHLSKALANQKLYEFRRQIEYKSKRIGIQVIFVGRFFPSSKACSSCGTIKKDLKLSDRTYKCECGLYIDRDLNASLNLKKYGELQLTK